MDCRTWRSQFEKWSDNPDDAPPVELREHAEVCVECRQRLNAVEALMKPAPYPVEPSRDLSAKVKARIRDEANRPARMFPDRYPRVVFQAAIAASLVVAVVLGVLIGRGMSVDSTGTYAVAPAIESAQTLRVEFRLEAPHAAEVAVVGDWNGWDSAAHPLEYRGDGVWETTVILRTGSEYQYQFLIDGDDWRPDPGAPLNVEDGFGGVNSVVNI